VLGETVGEGEREREREREGGRRASERFPASAILADCAALDARVSPRRAEGVPRRG
jgi:hypothetical protein